MDQVDYDAFKEKIDNLTLQNKQLKRANNKQRKKIKELRYVIRRLKADKTKKQHYKNGKRNSRYGNRS